MCVHAYIVSIYVHIVLCIHISMDIFPRTHCTSIHMETFLIVAAASGRFVLVVFVQGGWGCCGWRALLCGNLLLVP